MFCYSQEKSEKDAYLRRYRHFVKKSVFEVPIRGILVC